MNNPCFCKLFFTFAPLFLVSPNELPVSSLFGLNNWNQQTSVDDMLHALEGSGIDVRIRQYQ